MAENSGANEVETRQGASIWSKVKSVIMNIIMISTMMRAVRYFFGNNQLSTTQNQAQSGTYMNMFQTGLEVKMWYYLNENMETIPLSPNHIWTSNIFKYNDWYDSLGRDVVFTKKVAIEMNANLANNGSLSLITCIAKADVIPKPEASMKSHDYNCVSDSLTKYRKISANRKVNLLSSGINSHPTNDEPALIKSHWHPNITVNVLFDVPGISQESIFQPLKKHFQLVDDIMKFYPVVYINNFWNLHSDYVPISTENRTLELTITFYPVSMLKFQLYLAQDAQSNMGYFSSSQPVEEQDTLKRMLLETSPYLLVLTFIISLLHSVFELFAFKNDVQFWKNRDNLQGLSLRTVVIGVFQSLIVFLYVFDNDTNFMVVVTCGIGVLVDLWKLTRVIEINKITLDNVESFTGGLKVFGLYHISYKASYTASETQKYDDLAFKYLSWCFFPLFVAYVIYSLIYNEHKGWYSFILGCCYGFLLVFGFIMMTPQLFINYKLKSVAHLPWRMLTYKALNTFIDDIFAFVIRMPTMYRIGCLRDDVIFFIYLYQRWIYPTDPNRANEFGTCENEESTPIQELTTGSTKNSSDSSTVATDGKQKVE